MLQSARSDRDHYDPFDINGPTSLVVTIDEAADMAGGIPATQLKKAVSKYELWRS